MENSLTIFKPKAAVVVRRDMARNPVVMAALEPLERSVFLASTDKTVAEYDSRELAVELEKALKFIAKDVGYRATDDSERGYLIVRICEILKRYYGLLTMRDFRMAFEMSLTGELDEYLPKGRDGQADRGHYQQFNAEYVCKILNAYRYKRAAVLRKANDAMPMPEEERDLEQERKYRERTRRDCLAAFDYFKEHGHLPEISPIGEMLYYNLLADAGLAPEIEVTLDEQRIMLKRMINDYAHKGYIGDMNRLKEAGTDAPELQGGAYTLARRKALKLAFEQIAAQGLDLGEIIKVQ